ncbi:ABC transporter [Sporocytophaga myxococcoides]|uniref:ABC transporter n=1 Tax=Sporocytophaga myxococcoides TaxID=153721 RepID=A0A098LA69_9BACT|nr:ABC transporter ATP-binding protein [Sporocytophaga myxococcoides]GAL83780.1 ABC transporter [Sporocytophaga myxococcoides]
MKPILEINNISKKYYINDDGGAPYLSLRDTISAYFKGSNKKVSKEEFWALKDVSFTVNPGESIGIIGRNGAGKSTLLKILSKITPPTNGKILSRGRIASLLEVGTGFHAELTGRENIFLNGSILGLKKHEILKQFDSIVEFSGIEKFLDTQLKHYSSGMQLRLAFAVAAHLEPEILIIDEVLAVGDATFQKKCMGKMGEVSKSGRTILFVSHNLNAVEEICNKAILLQNGQLKAVDSVPNIVRNYLSNNEEINSCWVNKDKKAFINPYFTPTSIKIVDEDFQLISGEVPADKKVGVMISGEVNEFNNLLTVGFCVTTLSGTVIYWAYQTDVAEESWPKMQKGENRFVAWLPTNFINEGDYYIELIASIHFSHWICEPQKNSPSVRLSIRGGLSKSPYWMMARPGLMAPIIKFESLP